MTVYSRMIGQPGQPPVEQHLLRSQEGAGVKLYINTEVSVVRSMMPLFVYQAGSTSSMNLSTPDDVTSAELSFSINDPTHVLNQDIK